MTLTLNDPLEALDTGSDDGLMHAAHLECQLDSDDVLLMCGHRTGWLGLTDVDAEPRCPACWDPTALCPVCGA